MAVLTAAHADTIRIVCFGGSNTYGKNLARADAYPAQLEAMLKAKGHDVVVSNEGVNGQTTSDELRNLDSAVPAGTHIVIFQPGGNDRRKGGDTAGNIRQIMDRLTARKLRVIFSGSGTFRAYVEPYNVPTIDEINRLAPDDMQYDREHLTARGYKIVAEKLLPLVEPLLQQR